MPTTQHATSTATVLDAVRRVIDDDDRKVQQQRSVAVLRAVAVQKALNSAAGLETPTEDNWALLLSAIDRGEL